MVNQYTKIKYTTEEVNKIISLYKYDGLSFTKIGKLLNRQKNNIKKILVNEGVWVDNRDKLKKEVNEKEILILYKNGLSLEEISNKFYISKTPIKRIINSNGLLRSGTSNGKKIILTNEQESMVKELYLIRYDSIPDISKKTGLTTSFIDKYLRNVGFRRDKEKASSISSVRKYSGVPYDEYLANLSEYEKYRKKVINITNKQPIKNLPNYDKRGNYKNIEAYHLDHKYSISEGFKNGVSPEVIGNIENLEFIPWKENLKKKNKCSITMTQLINK